MRNNMRRKLKDKNPKKATWVVRDSRTGGILGGIAVASQEVKDHLTRKYKTVRGRIHGRKWKGLFIKAHAEHRASINIEKVENPILGIIGISGNASCPPDGSVNHDEYIYKRK